MALGLRTTQGTAGMASPSHHLGLTLCLGQAQPWPWPPYAAMALPDVCTLQGRIYIRPPTKCASVA